MATAQKQAKMFAPQSKLIKVRADSLQPHPLAQREISPSRINKLKATFDLDAVGTLHVVEYPIHGKRAMWIVDGQHRWRVLMDLGLGEWEVEVKVHLAANDDARASALFLKLNDRLTVRPFDKFRNRLQAKDGDAVAIDDIVRKHGFKIGANVSDGTICGISALEKSYRLDEGEALDKALGAVNAAWGKRSIDAVLIEGVSRVFARYNGTVDQPALVKKLSKYPGGPTGLVGDSRGLLEYTKATLPRCVAQRVIDTYNSGRRADRLEAL